jgi:hypothetical protein
MLKKLSLLAIALSASFAVTTQASSIPYANIGIEAPSNTFVATANGDVTAYFYATDAGYTSQIGLLVNGVSTGIYGLTNHSSSHGQSLVLGNVNAGDTLEFVLKVLTTGASWYSTASDNSDNKNHTYSTSFAGDSLIPVGTYVAFEDLPNLGDVDYNDHQFVFTNVSKDLPEPGSLALLCLGLVGLRFARKQAAK